MVPLILFMDSTSCVSIGAPKISGSGPDKELLEMSNVPKYCGSCGSKPVSLFELRSSVIAEVINSRVAGSVPLI
jgi:hypothetical protein